MRTTASEKNLLIIQHLQINFLKYCKLPNYNQPKPAAISKREKAFGFTIFCTSAKKLLIYSILKDNILNLPKITNCLDFQTARFQRFFLYQKLYFYVLETQLMDTSHPLNVYVSEGLVAAREIFHLDAAAPKK